MAGEMISMNVAKVVDVDGVETLEPFSNLSISSRDMLTIEKTTRGFLAVDFFRNVTLTGCYMVAWRVMKRRQIIPDEMTLAEFEQGYEISLSTKDDPRAQVDGDESERTDEVDLDGNPTH